MRRILTALMVSATAALLVSQGPPLVKVGRLPAGGHLLPTGWVLRPAGRQINAASLPMNSAVTPDGKYMVVVASGEQPSLEVIEIEGARRVSGLLLADTWLGLSITINGRLLYVGGGSSGSIFEVALSPEGRLNLQRTFTMTPPGESTAAEFIGDVALTPDNRLIYAADLFKDRILVVNPQSGRVIDAFPTGRRPYRILFHPDGKSYFVTGWGDGTIYQHLTEDGSRMGSLRLGSHTTDMVWRDRRTEVEEGEQFPYRARIFVTASNTNRAYSVGVTESKEMRLIEPISLSMTPRQPFGSTPSAVALSADESRLYIVCSDANAIAVADVTGPRSRVLGFVPTGWYPLAARAVKGDRLFVMNARSVNNLGPSTQPRTRQMVRVGRAAAGGSISVIEPFDEARLSAYTREVFENSLYDDRLLDEVDAPPGSPIPLRAGDPSPIQHVLYIVKEGRSYDDVLGDLVPGNGDASLCRFPEMVTPNHHALARQFVLLDNFYVNGELTADGQAWTTSAIAPPFAQRMLPGIPRAGRGARDADWQDLITAPPAGYIWTQVQSAGLSMRNYGFLTTQTPLEKVGSGGTHVAEVRDPVLGHVTNMRYRGPDPDYPDVERAKVFLKDLADAEASNDLPRFMALRLGNDRTTTAPGKMSPRSSMADNDYALGLIVEACSRSKFWSKMAIFVVEADAHDGVDHVDSHRSLAYIISPYSKRNVIDSGFYNTMSMVRTVELILGLKPMTVFDAAARPMWNALSSVPDPRPFAAEKPRVSLEERNPQP